MRRAFTRTLSVAMRSAVPPTTRPRLPKVPTPWVTWSVSPCTTVTSPMPMPKASATSCAKAVSWPWPWGETPVITVTLPGGLDAHLGALPGAVAREGARAGARAEAADLGEGRDADPDEAPLAPGRVPGATLGGVVEARDSLVEGALVVPAVVDRAGGRRVGEGAARDQVAAPDLDAIEARAYRDLVHHPLDDVGRLGPPGAAVGLGGHGVGVDVDDLEGDRLDGVGAAGQQVREGGDRSAEHRAVGADLDDRLAAQREELPVRGEGRLHVLHVAAAVGRVHEVLGARLRPLHRTPQAARDPGQQALLGIGGDLAAEAAAHLGRDDADADLGQAEADRDLLLHAVGRLGRGPDRELLRALVPVGEHRAPLHRHRRDALVHEAQLHHAGGAGEQALEGGVRLGGLVPADVGVELLVDAGRAGLERALGVDHRRQRVDLHLDVEDGVAGHVAVLRHHHRDGLPDVAHRAVGEERVRHVVHARQDRGAGRAAHLAAQVVVAEDADHALPGAGLRAVDAHDPARRVVAAHEGGVEHAVELDVVGVAREAADRGAGPRAA